MKAEEYREKIAKQNKINDDAIFSIQRDFALSNSVFKIGDVATDRIGSIRVQEIKIWRRHGAPLPECIYYGQTLKKDGTETKKKEVRAVYQSNLLTTAQQKTATIID